jgi:dTDP-4-amino-4,6-dideoxygalactose transaminase
MALVYADIELINGGDLEMVCRSMMDKDEVISKYPVARKVTTDTFFLGTSPVITDEQLNYIEKMVTEFFNQLN